MQGGLGLRFALEAGFLIGVAIAAGVAELSATTIVIVMAVAWLLVCVFELAVWTEGLRFTSLRREPGTVDEEAPEPAAEAESGPEPVAARNGEGA